MKTASAFVSVLFLQCLAATPATTSEFREGARKGSTVTVPSTAASVSEFVLKKYNHQTRVFATGSDNLRNGPSDYIGVRYSIPDEIEDSYEITQIRFYNHDEDTSWPVAMITHATGGGQPDLNNALVSFEDFRGPGEDWLTLNTSTVVNSLHDIFFVLQMPQGEVLNSGGGGAGVGVEGLPDPGFSFISGNVWSTDGTNFTDITFFNYTVEVVIETIAGVEPEQGTGDVDNNGSLTPGDALCSFRMFLSGQNLPADCDVDDFDGELSADDASCSASITPQDALHIFEGFLLNPSPTNCLGLVASGISKRAGFEAEAGLDLSPSPSIELTGPTGQQITVALHLTNTEAIAISAYGFMLTYPTNLLKFEHTDNSGTLTNGWITSQGQENSGGQIVVGGFHTAPLSSSGTLLKVVFETLASAGTGVIELSGFADGLAGATTSPGVINSTVPVELATFSAESHIGSVILLWQTVSETNNFGFEVEWRGDGQRYSRIGFVPGHGTTVLTHSYTYSHLALSPGRYFYRLKQIDVDGTFQYSSALPITVAAPSQFTLKQNFPNPFNPGTSVEYELLEAANVQLSNYNLLGQEIRTLVHDAKPAGIFDVLWNGKNNRGRSSGKRDLPLQAHDADIQPGKKLTLTR